MIHHVFANRSNIGDWLSAKGIQRLLQPFRVKEYLCDEPFAADTLHALAALPKGELVVIGGGGLFMDYFAPFWSGLREVVSRLNVCVWGVGYCDLKYETSHPPLEVIQEVVSHTRLCIVRDELTRTYLDRYEVPAPVACPSMVAIQPDAGDCGLLHVDNYTSAGADVYEAMDDICRDFAARTDRPYYKTNNRIETGVESELARRLTLYRRADLVVSSALHGCVIAVAMGRPVIAVSGDRKIEAFMSMAGLKDWVLDTRQVAALPALIEKLHTQPKVSGFARRVRSQNALIAERVRRILQDASADEKRT